VRNLAEVDHRQFGQTLLQRVHLGVDKPLPLLGRVIFGILAQIAVFARSEDFAGKFVAELVFQRVQLFL
jgi:hypothetical protein